MAWCYTFGVAIGDRACRDPMLVVEGQHRCSCDACGQSCSGLFAACETLVFAPGGLELQLKAVPPDLEWEIPLRDVEDEEPAVHVAASNGSRVGVVP